MGISKADQMALPDFDFGAMENWGLVTYRNDSQLWKFSSIFALDALPCLCSDWMSASKF